jgi:arsenite methyltransferase
MLERLSARMFNWSAARASRQPDRVLAALGLKEGDAVADLGSGGGYFAIRFARAVGPAGTVYAIDINSEYLRFVCERAATAGLKNLQTVHSQELDDRLRKGSLEMLFSRDVYHHLGNRTEYFRRMAAFLKPDGRVAIIDWLPDGMRFGGPPAGHRTAPELIAGEMEDAGFSVVKRLDFLRGQSFTIFGPRKD